MIAKDLDPFFGTSAMDIAGRQAEEQMAFYLRRRFHDSPGVFVINGLRFEHGGMYTQIDHLLVSLYGFQLIESKSVSSEVSVNERGEWQRFYDNKWRGMASPEEQAKEQLRILVALLNDNAASLTGKIRGLLQKGYSGYSRQAYVAISNNGIVQRADAEAFPLVMKADQLAGRIYEDLERWRKASSLTNLFSANAPLRLPAEELKRVVEFLLARHQPAASQAVAAHPLMPPEPEVIDVAASVVASSGIDTHTAQSASTSVARSRYFCACCQSSVSYAVARFCWNNKNKFGGKVYCMDHQKSQAG